MLSPENAKQKKTGAGAPHVRLRPRTPREASTPTHTDTQADRQTDRHTPLSSPAPQQERANTRTRGKESAATAA